MCGGRGLGQNLVVLCAGLLVQSHNYLPDTGRAAWNILWSEYKMGLLTGSASLTRFTVIGKLPESFWEFAAQRINAMSFRDIDETMDEYSIGWVSVADMFDAGFAYSSYAAGDYIVLTMRVDERKVSPAVLKKYVAKEEERIRRERQVERLNRSVRLEIRERVRAELVRKAPPIPATYDLCWNLADNILFFFSTNKKAMAQLEDLFKETFHLSIVLQIPWLMGERMVDDDLKASYEALRPAVLL